MPKKQQESPFSVFIPPAMMLKLVQHSKARGDLPIGAMIRLIITEWLSSQMRRDRRKKIDNNQPGTGA